MRNGRLNLRATITIDINTETFMDAGEHQRRLMELVQDIRTDYPGSVLDIREQRVRGSDGVTVHDRPPVSRTGNLRPYAVAGE